MREFRPGSRLWKFDRAVRFANECLLAIALVFVFALVLCGCSVSSQPPTVCILSACAADYSRVEGPAPTRVRSLPLWKDASWDKKLK